jgi:hypothetical protein
LPRTCSGRREVGWTLVPEYCLPNGRTPDGTFLDSFRLRHGYWEAKDTSDDLEAEIRKKLEIGYPADNILFEDTRRAVFYKGRLTRFEYDLRSPSDLSDLVRHFTSYSAPDYEKFHEDACTALSCESTVSSRRRWAAWE